MAKKKIPLFKPVDIHASYEGKNPIDLEWANYVEANYKNMETVAWPGQDLFANVELYTHNLESLKPGLSYLDCWLWQRIASRMYLNLKPEHIYGNALRTTYELSDKSKDIITLTQGNLMLCRDDDMFDFLSLNTNDPIIFETFVKSRASYYDVFAGLTTRIEEDGLTSGAVKYVISNLFQPNIMNPVINDRDLFVSFGLTAARTNVEFETFIENNKLDALTVTCLYQASKWYNQEIIGVEPMSDDMQIWFETNYPDVYKKYETLDRLGVPFADICMQIETRLDISSDVIHLPELN